MLDGGAGYELKVDYKGGWPLGPVQHVITVETDDARQPTIQIPVTATVLER